MEILHITDYKQLQVPKETRDAARTEKLNFKEKLYVYIYVFQYFVRHGLTSSRNVENNVRATSGST